MPVMKNIGTLYQCLDEGGQGDVQPIENAALVWQGDTITWVGREAELPGRGIDDPEDDQVHDAGGAIVTPALIDCHTHLAFGGWREDEFAARCRGASYLDIAKKGGGILKTVRQTRAMTEGDLLSHAQRYLEFMRRDGVGTVECKSGYGLTVEDELKLLRVYKQLVDSEDVPNRVVATLLGAHVVPPEYQDSRERYLDLLCEELIPQVAEHQLARFNDVFVEAGAFTIEEGRRILQCGIKYGLVPKLHVDQLCDGEGAELAAEVGAVSADHLEYTSDAGLAAMAGAGVVAVALPMASLVLRQRPLDARRFADAGVPIAVATDFNPGSAPVYSLQKSMALSCVMNYMTPVESLKGATTYAARALHLDQSVGSLRVGMQADFLTLDVESVDQWLYWHAPAALTGTLFVGGTAIVSNADPQPVRTDHV